MENVVSKIRLAKSFFTGRYCLKAEKGRRLTGWFKEYDQTDTGDFVSVETDIGTFIYHKNQEELLYEQYEKNEEAYMYKLTETIYYLQIYCSDNTSLLQFYKADGNSINMPALEDAYPIGNDLIAVKEFLGKWGILDENLNWKIHFTYEDIFEFIGKIAIGYRSESDTTDLIDVDENGNINIVNVDGYVLKFLTKELVVSKKGKKKGVYNTKGEKVLDFVFDDIYLANNHFILTNDELMGLADITGKILRECNCYNIVKTEKGFKLVTRQIVDTEEYTTV